MKCSTCGYDDHGTGYTAHVCNLPSPSHTPAAPVVAEGLALPLKCDQDVIGNAYIVDAEGRTIAHMKGGYSNFENAKFLVRVANAAHPEGITPVAGSVQQVAGLGSITNEDDGVLTLRFKDEESAQAFMQGYAPTVDCRDMLVAGSPAEVESGVIKGLRKMVEAYGPKSLQYDIEHPNDGLNSSDPKEVERVSRGIAEPMPASEAVGVLTKWDNAGSKGVEVRWDKDVPEGQYFIYAAAPVPASEAARQWQGSLQQKVADIPIPDGSNARRHGFVDAKAAVLDILRTHNFAAPAAPTEIDHTQDPADFDMEKIMALPDWEPAAPTDAKPTLTGYAMVARHSHEVGFSWGADDIRFPADLWERVPMSSAAQSVRDALMTIRAAIIDYYDAMVARKHGGVAMDQAMEKIESIFGLNYDTYRDSKKP